MSWPTTAPAWLSPWAIWFLKGKLGSKPANVPYPMKDIGWQFIKFYVWRAEGGLPSRRPADLSKTIPEWGWTLYKNVHAAVAPVAPPTPGLPAFKLPLMFTAWGFGNGTWTPDFLAQKCLDTHIGSVAIQITQASSDVAEAFTSRGIDICMWGIPGPSDASYLHDFSSDWYMPQIEDISQYTLTEQSLQSGVGKGGLISAVTTLGQEGPQVQDLVNLGCKTAFVECYGLDGYPHADIPRMLWQANHDGWPFAVPVVGLYGGYHLNNYDLSAVGKNFGVWVAELTSDPDWDSIRKKVESS